MLELLENAFIILFVVIDPVGLVPMFTALTHGENEARRRRMAVKGTALAAVILVMFAFVGDRLLAALGVGMSAFRIAGGLLLLLLAIDMVFARQSGLRSTTVSEQREVEQWNDISVFPLAFPLIAGPGALTTILLLVASSRGDPLAFAAILGVLLCVLGITLVVLLLAGRLMHRLGQTGANVITRLLGMMLAALAMQFVLDGLHESLFARAAAAADVPSLSAGASRTVA